MWRIVKVCPKCLGGEFKKLEDGYFKCIECDEEYDIDDLKDMDFEE